jgi:hypothetical protein
MKEWKNGKSYIMKNSINFTPHPVLSDGVMGGTFIVLGGELEMFGKFFGGTLHGKIPCRRCIHRENGNLKIDNKKESSCRLCDMMLNLWIL